MGLSLPHPARHLIVSILRLNLDNLSIYLFMSSFRNILLDVSCIIILLSHGDNFDLYDDKCREPHHIYHIINTAIGRAKSILFSKTFLFLSLKKMLESI